MRLLIIFISVCMPGCAVVKHEFLGCKVRPAAEDVSLADRTFGGAVTLSCGLWE